jgi:hypothetical protein
LIWSYLASTGSRPSSIGGLIVLRYAHLGFTAIANQQGGAFSPISDVAAASLTTLKLAFLFHAFGRVIDHLYNIMDVHTMNIAWKEKICIFAYLPRDMKSLKLMHKAEKRRSLNLLKTGLTGCLSPRLTIPTLADSLTLRYHPPHSLINRQVDISRRQNRHRPAIHPQPAPLRLGHSAELGKTLKYCEFQVVLG